MSSIAVCRHTFVVTGSGRSYRCSGNGSMKYRGLYFVDVNFVGSIFHRVADIGVKLTIPETCCMRFEFTVNRCDFGDKSNLVEI